MDDPILAEKINKLERILTVFEVEYTREGNNVIAHLPYLVMEELTNILELNIGAAKKITKFEGENLS